MNHIVKEPSTGSSLEKRKGLNVLHLKGTPFQRGLAHGILLKEEIRSSGIASYYGDFLKNIPFANNFLPLINTFLYKPLIASLSADTAGEMDGLAEATGIDPVLIKRAILAPDIMQLLFSGFLRGGKKGNGNYYLGGCSAAFACGHELKNGYSSLVARNLDFPGALVWRYPTIVYNHPVEKCQVPVRSVGGKWEMREKTRQSYMYISTAGFPGTGLTGYSNSGIFMATFICLSRESSRREIPSLDFNHRLFTALEDLDALPFLVEEMGGRSAVPHTVLLADGRRAMALEISSKRYFIRQEPPGFESMAQTNHFLSADLKTGEMQFPLEKEGSLERYRFIRDALEMYHGKLDPRKMVDIISSNYNRFSGRLNLVGCPTPAQPDTLMSVVFEPESGDFWMAEGQPPGVVFNKYRGFNGRGKSDPPDIRRSEHSLFNNAVSTDPGRDASKSLCYYTLAWEQMKVGRIEKAVTLLEKAAATLEDPGYFYILAILQIKCSRPEKALRIFRDIGERFSYTPLKDSVLPLWEGRCLDLLGKRDEALLCYRRGFKIPGLAGDFARAYKKGLRRPFTERQMPLSVNFNNPGPVNL